eukprot:CAMPEP_0175202742 /NCGR_PEP_ID=MMETSP0093-20121207/10709_1 /TAXON_ID=311494 /ORGANISM="Alexandrium monilatum, Strain CCMP3105" /LENGTH=302 /DNA_ID=CAMNT_0016495795 /DNA_START=146 /DNA_END=1050 /DNA_ORIENTATION=-
MCASPMQLCAPDRPCCLQSSGQSRSDGVPGGWAALACPLPLGRQAPAWCFAKPQPMAQHPPCRVAGPMATSGGFKKEWTAGLSAHRPCPHVSRKLLAFCRGCGLGGAHAGQRRHGDHPGGVHVALDVGEVGVNALEEAGEPLALILHLHAVPRADAGPACACLLAGAAGVLRLGKPAEVLCRIKRSAGRAALWSELDRWPVANYHGLRGPPPHQEDGGLRVADLCGGDLGADHLPGPGEPLDLALLHAAAGARGQEHLGDLGLHLHGDGQLQPGGVAAGRDRPRRHALQLHTPPPHQDLAVA